MKKIEFSYGITITLHQNTGNDIETTVGGDNWTFNSATTYLRTHEFKRENFDNDEKFTKATIWQLVWIDGLLDHSDRIVTYRVKETKDRYIVDLDDPVTQWDGDSVPAMG